ncbi:hypothetical protein [Streptomyces lavendulae]|uniref:hypothetical protein n=1 Tax=Streptomyces lavendulae TaxID=1914 RepID=UPI0024A47AB8|nr:hypothetical protein [Streptomyces lavendulae]GLX22980.1 hypothetical protein Slala01_66240 [Streptomyces lavendulae subsp. lavendulae]GLX30442.1 hypothetical protein Slala02_62620 [Streptomyces lavendulae subsp. lavendulae]
MSLREHGFALVALDPVPGAVAAGFREAPHRVVRLRMSWTADDDWLFLPVPSYDAPYDVPYDGADRRLEAGLAALLRRTLGGPWLDVHADWLIELYLVRTVAPAGTAVPVRLPGPSAPGGGGFGLVAVAGRTGSGSARARLFGAGRTAPLLEAAPVAGQGLLFDRRTVTHERHELLADPAGPVVQDLLVAHASRPGGPEPALRRRPMLVRGPAGTLITTRPALR